MSTRNILLTLLLIAALPLQAKNPQKRAVVIDTICNCSLEAMLRSAARFFYHFQACPDSLPMWAYVGIDEYEQKGAKKKQKRNAIELRYKDRIYDPQELTGDVAIDIYVLGMRWWKDQHLGTRQLWDEQPAKAGRRRAHMTATYSGSILEGADIIFITDSIAPNQTRVQYEFSLVFGKMLAGFISDNVWNQSIAWRFKMILENLVEYAETGTVRPKKNQEDDN